MSERIHVNSLEEHSCVEGSDIDLNSTNDEKRYAETVHTVPHPRASTSLAKS